MLHAYSMGREVMLYPSIHPFVPCSTTAHLGAMVSGYCRKLIGNPMLEQNHWSAWSLAIWPPEVAARDVNKTVILQV